MVLQLIHIKTLNYQYWEHAFIEYRLLSCALGLARDLYEIHLVLEGGLYEMVRPASGAFSVFEVFVASYSTLVLLFHNYPVVFFDTVHYTCETLQGAVKMYGKTLPLGVTSVLGLMSASAQVWRLTDSR